MIRTAEGLALVVAGLVLVAIGILLLLAAGAVMSARRAWRQATEPDTRVSVDPTRAAGLIMFDRKPTRVEAPVFSHVWNGEHDVALLDPAARAAWEEAQRAVDGRE